MKKMEEEEEEEDDGEGTNLLQWEMDGGHPKRLLLCACLNKNK